MKIIHLPTSVGNHGYSLACAERRKGFDSISLAVGNNKFSMKSDLNIYSFNKYFTALEKIKTFLSIRKKYDVYHFNYASSLIDYPSKSINYIDLPYYDGAKFVTFNGSDLRRSLPKEYNINSYFHDEDYRDENIACREKRLEKLLKYVDFCFVVNPDLMNFLPSDKAVFLPYIKESVFELKNFEKKTNRTNLKEFVIVHAPTNRKIKGSDFIIKSIEDLKKKFPIKFVLVENKSHAEAKKIYEQADLVIDQMRIGWYGGVSVEVMSMGIPVAVYINPRDLKFVPSDMRNAISQSFLLVDYFNFSERISELIDSIPFYNKLSVEAKNYVEKYHNPDLLIENVLGKYAEYV